MTLSSPVSVPPIYTDPVTSEKGAPKTYAVIYWKMPKGAAVIKPTGTIGNYNTLMFV